MEAWGWGVCGGGGCVWVVWGKNGTLPKICHSYPSMMKLGTVVPYLKKIQNIYESRDTPFMAIVDNWLSKLLFESDTYNAHFHQEKNF